MSLMIGGVVVREAPDAMFQVPAAANSSSNSSTLDLEARDAHRVQVAVALTTLVGLIQVRTLALTPDLIQVRTLALTPDPIQVRTLALTPDPIQVRTLSLTPSRSDP